MRKKSATQENDKNVTTSTWNAKHVTRRGYFYNVDEVQDENGEPGSKTAVKMSSEEPSVVEMFKALREEMAEMRVKLDAMQSLTNSGKTQVPRSRKAKSDASEETPSQEKEPIQWSAEPKPQVAEKKKKEGGLIHALTFGSISDDFVFKKG